MTPAARSTEPGRIVVDAEPIAFQPGDSVALAILRTGRPPARGGTLCLAGDCGNCHAEVDGVAYVRTCQTACRPGLSVVRHPEAGLPILPAVGGADVTASPTAPAIPVQRLEVDVVIVGGGRSGRTAAAQVASDRTVLVLDAEAGDEIVGLFPGPTLVGRTRSGMVHVRAGRVIVATGSAEVQPVCPGNELHGLLTSRAAERVHAAGIGLGTAVAIGAAPAGVPCQVLAGRLVRFEGDAGRLRAVVTADPATGVETTTPCDTAILGLGHAPRDALARMAGADAGSVTVVGSAAATPDLPDPPVAGVVCRCMGTTVADLEAAWDRGFTELELLKRALAGVSRAVPGRGLPAGGAVVDRSPFGHDPRPVHRSPRRSPDHDRRGRGRGRRSTPGDGPRSTTSTSPWAGGWIGSAGGGGRGTTATRWPSTGPSGRVSRSAT